MHKSVSTGSGTAMKTDKGRIDYSARSLPMCGEFIGVTVQFEDGAMSCCCTVFKM